MTRIIAGRFGGLTLRTPAGTSTRPTGERVREALFSALDHAGLLDDARVLDLYAGSGALGLEALSRGAAAVTLVDKSDAAIKTIRANAASAGRALAGGGTARGGTGADRPAVSSVRADAAAFLSRADDRFDVVLIDPPYAVPEHELARALERVAARLAPGGVVVVERAARSPEPSWPEGMSGTRSRKYGDTTLWWAEAASGADPGDGPATDDDVAAFARRLGLPGLFDVHTHFMPANVLEKVWRFFETNDRFDWPITYRQDEQNRVERLRALGVRRFTSMLYPHKPGMAEWLNGWAADFAARTPECLHTATFYPEPGNDGYVHRALEAGARVFKAHVQVGDYDPRDELLDGVWAQLEDAGVPTVIHCGSGPNPGRFTGPEPIRAVLRRHPRLQLIIAHLGMPEYEDFLAMAGEFDGVHLDTTMNFTDFTNELAPMPRSLYPQLRALQGKILLGSDFPNIPYPYAHQVRSLVGLGLGDDWLRSVLWHNAVRLFGVG